MCDVCVCAACDEVMLRIPHTIPTNTSHPHTSHHSHKYLTPHTIRTNTSHPHTIPACSCPLPQLILCREYTRAEDQDWHVNHFCCLRCDTGLGGKKYRPQDGQPFCLSCYEISFSTICEVRVDVWVPPPAYPHSQARDGEAWE